MHIKTTYQTRKQKSFFLLTELNTPLAHLLVFYWLTRTRFAHSLVKIHQDKVSVNVSNHWHLCILYNTVGPLYPSPLADA